MADEYFDDDEADLSTPVLQIGDQVPNFSCETTTGLITAHEAFQNKWTLLMTIPKNRDPVSVSQLAEAMRLKDEFDARGCQIVASGVDTKMNHKMWLQDVFEFTEEKIDFPVIEDPDAELSKGLGLCRPDEANFHRAAIPTTLTMLIDPDLTIQLINHYTLPCGQNLPEIMRCLDSMILTRKHKVSTPANWMVGEDVFIIPSIPRMQAQDLFPKGFLEVRHWFRITSVPDDE